MARGILYNRVSYAQYQGELRMEDNPDIEIDPEIWTQFLLAVMGDKERSAELVQELAQKTGVSPEKVELIMAATVKLLANRARSN